MSADKGVVVVGSANADLVVRVSRHPAPGETVLGSDLEVHPGGKGANQAVAAARLGARVAFVGRVGRDAHGDLLVGTLEREGVDCSELGREQGAPTGVALIVVGGKGENAIVVSPGANSRVTGPEAGEAVRRIPEAGVVSAQLEIPMEAVLAAARAAEGVGARFLLNPSPPEGLLDEDFAREVLPFCDPLVVNEHEARLLARGSRQGSAAEGGQGPPEAGVQEPPEAGAQEPPEAGVQDLAGRLLGLGVRSAVVTLGERGALVAEGDRRVRIPGVPVRAVDTTGAGDAFTGALAWRLCLAPDLVAAAHWAVRVGAAAVLGHGAQSSYPRAEELPHEPGDAPGAP
ncbi:ribokinase [Wenjunlia tyrosinilytica]|uniref:Ribokinase n=1 Tax=Wenjunlia tyrosinilytica TaxID=1544741 RepID=A0A917ZLM8_9ACTN|nr:ribokinase [Wenjunlia tyrosinilytica]GGO86555.1 ribokinase [Wenjunlia tyrosinilytica]